jgi:hypothetical protein
VRHQGAPASLLQIAYIPLGQLSPSKLKKLRVVHVLDSYQRRDEAKQYIW